MVRHSYGVDYRLLIPRYNLRNRTARIKQTGESQGSVSDITTASKRGPTFLGNTLATLAQRRLVLTITRQLGIAFEQGKNSLSFIKHENIYGVARIRKVASLEWQPKKVASLDGIRYDSHVRLAHLLESCLYSAKATALHSSSFQSARVLKPETDSHLKVPAFVYGLAGEPVN